MLNIRPITISTYKAPLPNSPQPSSKNAFKAAKMQSESEPVIDKETPPIFSKLAPRISLSTHALPFPYTTGYAKIAPHSRILLIKSAVPILISTYPTQWEAIKPHRTSRPGCNGKKGSAGATLVKPRIVIHTFSNGGTNSAARLLIVLSRQLQAPLPLAGIICDSGPVKRTYWKSYKSMLFSLPKGFLASLLGPLAIHFILVVLFSSIAAGRYDRTEDIIRHTLLRKKMVDCRNICYIFSKSDKMVEWEDVISHTDEARGRGWLVNEICFNDTTHCNHVSKHAEQYFRAMKSVWEDHSMSLCELHRRISTQQVKLVIDTSS
ncbi:hypothetical protein M501DRAFT_1033713 [Patellaria atrata CBS 101060]|uniref:Indole-diterpene biosynthesis protein PaxU n=1 Tax=Patellaria atrata CBS 101060 TaxID=1346257 RepID=A0A9P4S672_9PEZI|nr:hypothetical protein M501DRAFT_1033713 [Patellaria atrata CBS 101060]